MRDKIFQMRISGEEKFEIDRAAKLLGKGATVWAREVLLQAAMLMRQRVEPEPEVVVDMPGNAFPPDPGPVETASTNGEVQDLDELFA